MPNTTVSKVIRGVTIRDVTVSTFLLLLYCSFFVDFTISNCAWPPCDNKTCDCQDKCYSVPYLVKCEPTLSKEVKEKRSRLRVQRTIIAIGRRFVATGDGEDESLASYVV